MSSLISALGFIYFLVGIYTFIYLCNLWMIDDAEERWLSRYSTITVSVMIVLFSVLWPYMALQFYRALKACRKLEGE